MDQALQVPPTSRLGSKGGQRIDVLNSQKLKQKTLSLASRRKRCADKTNLVIPLSHKGKPTIVMTKVGKVITKIPPSARQNFPAPTTRTPGFSNRTKDQIRFKFQPLNKKQEKHAQGIFHSSQICDSLIRRAKELAKSSSLEDLSVSSSIFAWLTYNKGRIIDSTIQALLPLVGWKIHETPNGGKCMHLNNNRASTFSWSNCDNNPEAGVNQTGTPHTQKRISIPTNLLADQILPPPKRKPAKNREKQFRNRPKPSKVRVNAKLGRQVRRREA